MFSTGDDHPRECAATSRIWMSITCVMFLLSFRLTVLGRENSSYRDYESITLERDRYEETSRQGPSTSERGTTRRHPWMELEDVRSHSLLTTAALSWTTIDIGLLHGYEKSKRGLDTSCLPQ